MLKVKPRRDRHGPALVSVLGPVLPKCTDSDSKRFERRKEICRDAGCVYSIPKRWDWVVAGIVGRLPLSIAGGSNLQ